MFEEIQSAHDVFSRVFSFAPAMLTLKVNDRLHQLGGMYVSGAFFSTLGSRAVMGRTIEQSDNIVGAAPVIVLSYRFWQTELGADPAITGATALINGREFQIVGIAAHSFPKLAAGLPEDFWLPLASQRTVTAGAPDRNDPRSLVLEVIARLQPGLSIGRAEAELNAICAYRDQWADAHFQKRGRTKSNAGKCSSRPRVVEHEILQVAVHFDDGRRLGPSARMRQCRGPDACALRW